MSNWADMTYKPIEHYEQFLSIRKGADIDIAEVDDAKKKLEELKQ
jgi:hypothetical protein